MEWGFCNGLRAGDILKGAEPLAADAFAAAVLMAEGADARPGAPHYLEIRRLFKGRYGSLSVSQSDYGS